MTTYTTTLTEDENGDLILQIPPEVLAECGWQEGDTLNFADNNDGSFTLTRIWPNQPSIDDLLLAILGSHEFVETWWNSPNAHFNFKPPIDCDRESVYSYVLQHSNQ
jgi:hypothetical protein